MQISVTFRHLDSTPALQDYATEQVSKIAAKYLANASSAHVVLTVEKLRHTAEINLHASHFDVSAHVTTDDLYSALDAALDKIERQLRKHKDRINHHKGRTPAAGDPTMIPVDVFGGDDDDFDAEGAPIVVEADNIPAKPLSIEDAILQLELNHAEFLVFRNAAKNESISVVYKRRDGNYGLITPNA